MNREDVLWVLVATIVATVLKWADNRWPAKPPAPPRRRRRPKPKPVVEEE